MTMAAPSKLKGGDLARLCGIWCNDAKFQRWIGAPDADTASAKVRFMCGVESRAELDHNPTAAQIFHNAIRKPYRDHLLAPRS